MTSVSRTLEARGLTLLDLTTTEQLDTVAGGSAINFGRSRRDVLEATRALATLLPAGLPLARALTTASIVTTGVVATSLQRVREGVEKGDTLAHALAQHPRLFSPVYVGVVRAGERSGDLAGAFVTLAEQLERAERLRSRLLSASLYPMVLAVAGGVAVAVLLLLVLPRFAEMLTDTGGPLPRSTALLVAVAAGAREHWPMLAALSVAVVATLAGAWRTSEGRRVGAAIILRLPVIGSLRRHVLAARSTRLTGVLLAGGAPLLSALEDAAGAIEDPLARDELVRIRARIREGSSLHRAIADGALFPPLVSQLIAVGEEAGRLHEFLLKAASILEERTERLLQRLVALAEPAMIVVFGGLVGFVALSLLQAIYGVNVSAMR